MKIALFTDTYTPDINGVVSSIVTLRNALIEKGHEVYVVTTHHSLLTIKFEDQVLRLPGIEIKRMYGYVLSSPLQFKAFNILKDIGLDIIHIHTEFGVGLFGYLVGKMMKLPIVSTYHTMYEDYTHYVNVFHSKTVEKIAKATVSKLSKIYGSSCMAIIAPSQKTKEMLLRYGIKRDIFVVPTGLNLDRFDKSLTDPETIKTLKETCLITDEKVIVFVGRIAKEKSIDLVIDGFSHIDLSKYKVKLVIVGAGPSEESIKQQVLRLNLEQHVKFLGKIPNENIPSIYHFADAFVSASLTETQGLTFIEAMASELPLFARYDDVLSDLVIDQETGFIFDDALSFSQKVTKWLELDDAQQLALKKNAKMKVEKYDRRIFADSVLSVYQQALKLYYNTYVIEDLVIKGDIAEIHTSNRFEKYHVKSFTDIVTKNHLKKDEVISKQMWDELLENQELVKAYEATIRKLAVKDRTRKEIYDFLTTKTSCNIKQVNQIIDRLQDQGYLDDQRYVLAMILNFRSLLIGKNRITRSLLQKGIPYEMIQEALESESNQTELTRAMALAEKIKPLTQAPSIILKKTKIRQKLIQQGYDIEVADEVIRQLDFNHEYLLEQENCYQLGLKYWEKNKSKYQDNSYKLKASVFRSLSNKGFQSEVINSVLSKLEEEDGI